MGDIVIRAEGLSKRYEIGAAARRHDTLRATIAESLNGPWFSRKRGTPRRGKDTFWALKDVSFEVNQGEIIGIIGGNGAGKSTLLKILSRITRPTHGTADIDGRVNALLEVGTGFHPELTGRQNIELNGSIMGMRRREVARKFDEIVAFAEVEKFIDMPVKRYSSGMYVRLAFAVAAHLEPEILIVDEVLAVGDAAFQKKCLGKIDEVARGGRTILFVSHNLGVIQTLCQSVILLVKGETRRIGRAKEVVADYLNLVECIRSTPIADRTDRIGEGRFRFAGVELLDAQGRPSDFAITGEDVGIRMKFWTARDETLGSAPLDVAIMIRDNHYNLVTALSSYFTGGSPTRIESAREVTCHVPRFPLLAGQYRLDLWCGISDQTQDKVWDAASLRVEPGNYFGNAADIRLPVPELHGCCMIPQVWGDAPRSECDDATDQADRPEM